MVTGRAAAEDAAEADLSAREHSSKACEPGAGAVQSDAGWTQWLAGRQGHMGVGGK